MPFLRFDLIEGRTPAEIRTLLDTAHEAVLTAFKVPVRDRYQIVHEHARHQVIAEDTGLGFERSPNFVMLQMTTSPRKTEDKQTFYRLLCEGLKARCGIEPNDVMVSIVENTIGDWSFGFGEAQYLTGELPKKAQNSDVAA